MLRKWCDEAKKETRSKLKETNNRIDAFKLLIGNERDDEELAEFMQGGIKIKTMNDYAKEIRRFQAYLEERGTGAKVKNYLLDPIDGTTSNCREQARELALYAMRLSEDKTLTTSAFDAQFHAIRRYMLNNTRDISVFNAESLTEARRIARNIVSGSRKRAIENMKSDDKEIYEARYGLKVPFTEEMIREHRDTYWSADGATVEEKMAYIATALSYHLGNRPSESSSNGPLAKDKEGKEDEDHRYVVDDIQYQVADGSFITGPDINEINKPEIQYIAVMVDSHKGETLKMLASKGSNKREANAIRNDNGELELQLFNDMIEWPDIARLKPNDLFFSRNTTAMNKGRGNLKLTSKAMVEKMKETASKLGVDRDRISAKSLRKALGTDLTRSNVPTATSNRIGRWAPNSNVCTDVYASATQGNVTGTMSHGITRSSIDDVQRLGRNRSQIARERVKGSETK